MILKALTILRDELDEQLNLVTIENNHPEPVEVVIDSIAREDNDDTAISNKVVITLLNVEEELTLKNSPRYESLPEYKNKDTNKEGYVKKNRPAYLNLYVMIAANRNTYEKSLANISKVIEALQVKKVLYNNSQDLKFKVQLHPLAFDQLSYAWGLLGGKVMPSALYKISIIKIQNGEGSTIELVRDIDIESKKK